MLSYNISLQPKHNANLANTFLSAKDKIANSQQQKEKNTFYSKKNNKYCFVHEKHIIFASRRMSATLLHVARCFVT